MLTGREKGWSSVSYSPILLSLKCPFGHIPHARQWAGHRGCKDKYGTLIILRSPQANRRDRKVNKHKLMRSVFLFFAQMHELILYGDQSVRGQKAFCRRHLRGQQVVKDEEQNYREEAPRSHPGIPQRGFIAQLARAGSLCINTDSRTHPESEFLVLRAQILILCNYWDDSEAVDWSRDFWLGPIDYI